MRYSLGLWRVKRLKFVLIDSMSVFIHKELFMAVAFSIGRALCLSTLFPLVAFASRETVSDLFVFGHLLKLQWL